MSLEEFSALLSNVLMVALVKGGEADRRIPEGFQIECETDNLKIRFDIDVDVEFTDAGHKAFKQFSASQYGRIVHIYGSGELND